MGAAVSYVIVSYCGTQGYRHVGILPRRPAGIVPDYRRGGVVGRVWFLYILWLPCPLGEKVRVEFLPPKYHKGPLRWREYILWTRCRHGVITSRKISNKSTVRISKYLPVIELGARSDTRLNGNNIIDLIAHPSFTHALLHATSLGIAHVGRKANSTPFFLDDPIILVRFAPTSNRYPGQPKHQCEQGSQNSPKQSARVGRHVRIYRNPSFNTSFEKWSRYVSVCDGLSGAHGD